MVVNWLHAVQESLGGNAKTSLVIAVANAMQHSEETLQSLQFGSRAMRVKTQVCNTHLQQISWMTYPLSDSSVDV